MKPAVVIADDLTGAADTGVGFTRAGFSAAIVFSPGAQLDGDVLVFSSESRHASASEARRLTRSLLPAARDAAYVYKKVDSTLRGNPGPELAEMVSGLGVEKVLVAPAFPAQGRTTVSGFQRVHGELLESTPFGREGASSDLCQTFSACGLPVRQVSLEILRSGAAVLQDLFAAPGPALLVGDAQTDADLQALVAAALQAGIRLFCGSAGLAAVLAGHFPKNNTSGGAQPFPKRAGPILVVAGSRNPVTAGQVDTARVAGLPVLALDPDFEASPHPDAAWLADAVGAHLSRGQDVVLALAGSQDSCLGPAAVAQRLGRWAGFFASAHTLGGLVLTGGDIARASLSALDAGGIRLYGEVQPGIPLGTVVAGAQPGLPVITKAGGFGTPDALVQAIQVLRM
jgi:D-threonate/D-erythronate kinase